MRYFFSLVLILLIIPTVAQETIFEQTIKIDKAIQTDSYLTQSDVGNEFAFTLKEGNYLWGMSFDELGKLAGNVATNVPDKRYEVHLGSTFHDGVSNLYFSNSMKTNFIVKTLDYKSKTSEENRIPVFLNEEFLVGGFRHKKHFYFLVVNEVRPVLKLYKLSGAKTENFWEMDFSKYGFEKSSLFKFLGGKASDFYLPKIENIVDGKYQTLQKGTDLIKAYSKKDGLMITVDDKKEDTKIIDFNLETEEFTFRSIPKPDCECRKVQKVNSFILDNYIFNIQACQTHVSTTMRDLESLELLYQTKVEKSENIEENTYFKTEEKSGLFDKEQIKIISSGKFVDNVDGGFAGLVANQYDGQLEMKIGSIYFKTTAPVSNFGFSPSIGSVNTASGVVNLTGPLSFQPPYFRYQGGIVETFYYQYVNIADLSETPSAHGTINPYRALEEKINDVVKEKSKTLSIVKIDQLDEVFLLSYYNKKTGKFIIEKWEL